MLCRCVSMTILFQKSIPNKNTHQKSVHINVIRKLTFVYNKGFGKGKLAPVMGKLKNEFNWMDGRENEKSGKVNFNVAHS